jgi:predicted outer membrane protein
MAFSLLACEGIVEKEAEAAGAALSTGKVSFFSSNPRGEPMIRNTALAVIAAAALTTGAWAAQEANPSADQNSAAQNSAQQSSAQQGSAQESSAHAESAAARQESAQMENEAMSSNPDRAFAAALISHARLQRQLSDLVAQKATNPQVKQLAQEVSTDNQQFSQQVQQAAQKEGITLNPERMLPRDRAVLRHMERLPVAALERNYVFYEAGANQTSLLFAQWAANNAQRPEIKDAAKSIADKLQTRNQTIQQLAQTEIAPGTAQPAGGTLPPGENKPQ